MRRNNLRIVREICNLKSSELAELIGKSLMYYSYIEAGRRNPSFETACNIANTLGVTVSDKLFEMNEKADHNFINELLNEKEKRSKSEN